jgi:hypothetical protein
MSAVGHAGGIRPAVSCAPYKRPPGLVAAYCTGRGIHFFLRRGIVEPERIGPATAAEREAYTRGLRHSAAVREHQEKRADEGRLLKGMHELLARHSPGPTP